MDCPQSLQKEHTFLPWREARPTLTCRILRDQTCAFEVPRVVITHYGGDGAFRPRAKVCRCFFVLLTIFF